jgi:hypothetical protein
MGEDMDKNFLLQDTLGPGATLKYSQINYNPFNRGNLLLAHQEFCSTYLYTYLRLKTTKILNASPIICQQFRFRTTKCAVLRLTGKLRLNAPPGVLQR